MMRKLFLLCFILCLLLTVFSLPVGAKTVYQNFITTAADTLTGADTVAVYYPSSSGYYMNQKIGLTATQFYNAYIVLEATTGDSMYYQLEGKFGSVWKELTTGAMITTVNTPVFITWSKPLTAIRVKVYDATTNDVMSCYGFLYNTQ